MWEDVLGIRPIGVEDNFFDLGGHSLKGMMLIADIQSALKKKVPLKALFDCPTVSQLARYIESSEKQSIESEMQPAEKSDWYPVSSAQKRMYVLHQIEKNGTGYNMPSAFMMEGDLHVDRLKRALQTLVDRHEALRTSFADIDGSPVQKSMKMRTSS
ncbi:condensation domain-containing protein [Bacillus sonorensis]|nr:condensation domain-containing protein [Bacillus sonorensis]